MENSSGECQGENSAEEDMYGSNHASPRPQDKLPTLQRNALRKLFDRPDFSPEEVAALGYKRLQKAEGVGDKGLQAILAWLKDYGFCLQPCGERKPAADRERSLRMLRRALRILQAHGFEAIPRSDSANRLAQALRENA